jgi:hypothetical protein
MGLLCKLLLYSSRKFAQPRSTTEGREMDDQFGACPECGKRDGYRNIYRQHFFFCEEHRITWVPGTNLFSSWREESKKDWREAWEQLKDYRVYDPDAPADIGPPLGEVASIETMVPPSGPKPE